jgi:aldehyde dehydrogenase (NAD+)
VPSQRDNTIKLVEAATEKPFGVAVDAVNAEIDRAVAAAPVAFPEWSRRNAAERAEMLGRLAAAPVDREDATAELVSRENGMPISRR